MNKRLERLGLLLKQKVEEVVEEAKYKTFINDDKIALKVTRAGVDVSLIVQKDASKRKTNALTDEEKAQLRAAKKLMKENLDLWHLTVLLSTVKQEMGKIDFKKIPSEKLEVARGLAVGIKNPMLLQRNMSSRQTEEVNERELWPKEEICKSNCKTWTLIRSGIWRGIR